MTDLHTFPFELANASNMLSQCMLGNPSHAHYSRLISLHVFILAVDCVDQCTHICMYVLF